MQIIYYDTVNKKSIGGILVINEKQKLGEIVTIFPLASEVFNKYKIDFCCGGHDTLQEALAEKGLSTEKIVKELNDEYDKFKKANVDYVDWSKETPKKLIRHIIRTHHDFTRNELNELDFLINKILKVHFEHHGEELLELHRLFGLLRIDLQQHLVKEEEILFPLIEEYEDTNNQELLTEIKKFIEETENEHHNAGDILKEIEVITNDFQTPDDVCNTYRLVFAKLNALEKDLFRHIYLENSVLFAMIK